MFCPKCKQEKEKDQFYNRPDRNGKKQSYCKVCNLENTLERQREFKKKCVEYKGGKCSECEYSKCINALEFHHLDPKEKEFNFSKYRNTSWEKNKIAVIKELEKCILVCANCHREIHYNIVSLPGFEPGKSL